jgi:hypothetical protein
MSSDSSPPGPVPPDEPPESDTPAEAVPDEPPERETEAEAVPPSGPLPERETRADAVPPPEPPPEPPTEPETRADAAPPPEPPTEPETRAEAVLPADAVPPPEPPTEPETRAEAVPPAEPPAAETYAVPPAAAAPTEPTATAARPRRTGHLRFLAVVLMIGGLILLAAGAFTWFVVRDQLSDEKITVSEDADHFAGEEVDGPLTAYAEADIINEHALEETDGLTYAQLDRDDPRRETAVTASFLRASLFTSVVAFGVAAFAAGMGLLMLLIGWALLRVERALRTIPT